MRRELDEEMRVAEAGVVSLGGSAARKGSCGLKENVA
jgi:hypothetical protein